MSCLGQANAVGPAPSANGHAQKLRSVFYQAKTHCVNFCSDGTCLGTGVDLLTACHFRWQKAGSRCLLALGQRCPYFEESVLPMEKRGERDWPTFTQGKTFREAAQLYREAFPETVVVQPITRRCPDCGKHRIEPRKRYCAKCRIRRRKVTDTAKKRRWRNKGGQCPPVKQNGSSLGAASRATDSSTRYYDPAERVLTP